MASLTASRALAEFGFTALEAEAYAFLLRESPATGYRVAQGIQKPVANTYKALETLEQKGALLVEHSETKLCRPVPPDELLARLGAEFERRRELAKAAFQQVTTPPAGDRIYELRSFEQAEAKATAMLECSGRVVLLACTVAVAQRLRNNLLDATERGVQVGLTLFEDGGVVGVESARSITDPLGPSDLYVAIDGVEALEFAEIASVSSGLWTRNPLVAKRAFQGLAAQHALAQLSARLEEGAGAKRLAKVLREMPRL
jgi:sugar-specific transcriptional regulator TrmB